MLSKPRLISRSSIASTLAISRKYERIVTGPSSSNSGARMAHASAGFTVVAVRPRAPMMGVGTFVVALSGFELDQE